MKTDGSHIPWYRSIRFLIPAVLVVAMLVPLAGFWGISLEKARAVAFSHADDVLYTGLYGSSVLMDGLLDDVEQKSSEFVGSSDLRTAIKDYQVSPDKVTQSALTLQLGQFKTEVGGMESAALVFDGGPFVLTSSPDRKVISESSPEAAPFINKLAEFDGAIEWMRIPDTQGHERMAFIRPVDTGGGAACCLVCFMDDSEWQGKLQTAEYLGEEMYIGSYSGDLLVSSDDQAPEDLLSDPSFRQAYDSQDGQGSYSFDDVGDDPVYLSYYRATESGLYYVARVPLSSVLGDASAASAMPFWGIVGGLALIGIVIGFLMIYRFVLRPVNALMANMELAERGQFRGIEDIPRYGEMGLLLNRYNRMTGRIKRLIDEASAQQFLRKQAQLVSLESQMDEHFLYNTLNAVYCKALDEDASDTGEMLILLSRYFRLSLSKGRDKVPLSEIVQLMRDYLHIQQIRFGQTLHYEIDAFDDVGRYRALKYLFQPILENAIVHGFEKSLDGCFLKVTLTKEGDVLQFTVIDNGIGMSEEAVQEINRSLGEFESVDRRGALQNLREQIRIEYGEEYGIVVASRLGEGTTVHLRVPLEALDVEAGDKGGQ